MYAVQECLKHHWSEIVNSNLCLNKGYPFTICCGDSFVITSGDVQRFFLFLVTLTSVPPTRYRGSTLLQYRCFRARTTPIHSSLLCRISTHKKKATQSRIGLTTDKCLLNRLQHKHTFLITRSLIRLIQLPSHIGYAKQTRLKTEKTELRLRTAFRFIMLLCVIAGTAILHILTAACLT